MDQYYDAKNSAQCAWNKHAGAFESKCKALDDAADEIQKGLFNLSIERDLLAAENDGADVRDDDLLEINAGGRIVTATRGTLTQLADTRLAALFSGRWEKRLQRDRDGRIFLDVNASCFQSVVDYLNELRISPPDDPPDPPHVDDTDKFFLGRLLSVFGIDETLAVPLDSVILREEGYYGEIQGFLAEDNICENLELLYRGSRDGFGASTFHERCDNKGPTVTCVRCTGGFVFGGYADIPWSSNDDYLASSKSFLFALKSHSGIGSTKMRIKAGCENNAVLHNECYGPSFGYGCDLHISENPNTDKHSYFGIGESYHLPDGQDDYFIIGTSTFRVAEIEVFRFGTAGNFLLQQNKKQSVAPGDGGEEWTTNTHDEFPADIKTALDKKQTILVDIRDKLQQQALALERETQFMGAFMKGENEDIVEFNVSGERLTVKRTTLGLCKDSVLAKQFNDPLWKREKVCPSVKHWDCEQVQKWASEIKAVPGGEVGARLRQNAIVGSELLHLGRDDLREMGITRPGTLATVVGAIGELKKSAREDDVTFIGQSAYCFGKMIDQLRLCAMCQADGGLPPPPEVRDLDKKRFRRIVEYYFPGEEASSFILGHSK